MSRELLKRLLWRCGLVIARAEHSESPLAMTSKLVALTGATLVLDVGANEGQFAGALLTYLPDVRILSFEPSADAHRKASARAASYSNWNLYERTAVGAQPGTVELNIAENSVSSSVLAMANLHAEAAPESRYTARTESVRCVPLDDALPPQTIAGERIYLKIDTQGFEKNVIAGADRTLDRVFAIQCEVSFVELYKGQPVAQEIVALLDGKGFDVFGYSNGLRHPVSHKLLQADIYFVRRSGLN